MTDYWTENCSGCSTGYSKAIVTTTGCCSANAIPNSMANYSGSLTGMTMENCLVTHWENSMDSRKANPLEPLNQGSGKYQALTGSGIQRQAR